MSENGFQFRTAAFGGFRKEDVLAYLEQSAREHGEKAAALQRELAQVKAVREELEEKGVELVEYVKKLEAENERLTAELSAATERRDELETVSRQMKGEMERLGPAAEAYESIKSRTAGIELEAHGRAQQIEEEGRRKAQKAQEELLAWMDKVIAAYGHLRSDLDATLSHALREMQRVNQNLGDIAGDFTGHDEALKVIRQELEDMNVKQPPQPLPLEEEPLS